MTCIIVDDNELAIESLTELIKHFCPQVKIIGTAQSVKNAVKLINELKPEIVFLDVEMNNESGFDLFSYFPQNDFLTIFTTSHEKYAVKAFKTDCFDYLLKPIDPTELNNTINKIEKEKIKLLSHQREEIREKSNRISKTKKIAIVHNKDYIFIEENDIVYFKADGQYTQIFTINNQQYTSTKNIGDIEKDLSDTFFRCHKSWIINLNYVSKFLKEDSIAVLSNNIEVEISSRKKDDFIKLFYKL